MASFLVDRDHPGVDEQDWLTDPTLSSLALLEPPVPHRVIVVAPHPDDEVLGAGGLLQTLAAAGTDLELWAVTDGEACDPSRARDQLRRERTDESLAALARLQVAGTRPRLGLPDGQVARYEDDLAQLLADRLGPEAVCLAPWELDGHPDHDACGRAAQTAVEASGAQLLCYLVWAWHWAEPGSGEIPWARGRRWRLTEDQLQRKRWAIDAFASQIRRPTGAAGGDPVLPAAVLRRFRRSFEVYLT